MAEDAALGVAEVAGVAEVEEGAGDSDIQDILHFQYINFSTFLKPINIMLILQDHMSICKISFSM